MPPRCLIGEIISHQELCILKDFFVYRSIGLSMGVRGRGFLICRRNCCGVLNGLWEGAKPIMGHTGEEAKVGQWEIKGYQGRKTVGKQGTKRAGFWYTGLTGPCS